MATTAIGQSLGGDIMRYSKNSIIISEKADKPLLRLAYCAGHLTFDQLYDAVHPILQSKANRDSLSWRVRRLMKHGFLERKTVDGLADVLALGESGELYLQGHEGGSVQRASRARGTNARSQVWHDVDLFRIQAALRCAGVVLTWQSESEVRAQNRSTSMRFAKEYDAVVTIRVGDFSAPVAMEFERTMKSREAYMQIAAALDNEQFVSRFLYLVPDSQAQLLLLDSMQRTRLRIYVGLTGEFCADPRIAPLLDVRFGSTCCLEDCLREGR
jgi:hypothetical protein